MQAHNDNINKGPLSWMARNPVAANILMVVLLVGGFLISTRITKDVFPSFTVGAIIISVSYPGATPEEIEKSIVNVIEDSLESVDGIKETAVKISPGTTQLTLTLHDYVDENKVLQDVKAEIDRISTFPKESERPVIALRLRHVEVLNVLLYGNKDYQILRYWADIIKDDLSQSPLIANVEVEGAKEFEIHVEVPQDNLRKYGLKLEDIATVIGDMSIELGGGTLKTRAGDILLNVDERRDYAAEFADIVVRTNEDGSRLMLEDIATISEGVEDVTRWSEFNGEDTLFLAIYKNESNDPVTVANAALKIINYYNEILPGDIRLEVRNNLSDIYKDRAETLINNAVAGVLLVFVCLAVFLRPSLALWVSLGIPTSILGGFWFFIPFDLTINVITMFAFIVTLGIVVDDAIVVGENISSWQDRGKPAIEAAVCGIREVAIPVVFSVLTNMLTFLPILFVPGMMGKIWAGLPLIVIAVFSCSLLESLFVLPAHLSHQKKVLVEENAVYSWWKEPIKFICQKQDIFNKAFLYFVEYRYGAFINYVIKNRYVTVAIGIALLFCSISYALSGRLGFDLMPRAESDYAFAEATMPAGAPQHEIDRIKNHLVDAAKEIIAENGEEKLSKGVYARISEDSIQIRAFLTDANTRPITTEEFTNLWREKVGVIPGVETLSMLSDRGGPGSGKGLTVFLSHRDTDVLNLAAADLAYFLQEFPEVGDIDAGISNTRRQFDLKLLPLAGQLGFTSRDIASQVRAAYEGVIALRQQRGTNEITVRVRLPENETQLAYFEDLVLRSPSGQEVLLRDIVQVIDTMAEAKIIHDNGRKSIQVTANINPSSATSMLMRSVQANILPELMVRYPGLHWRFGGRQQDMQESTNTMIYGLLFSLLGIYALLAIPFKSYTQPFIIMVSIPFGIVGSILGHMLLGHSLSVISIFGMVALTGVVVNDSLVLIDFANIRRLGGQDCYTAVRQAAIQRFRPILLTTLTTFMGLMPMMFETSKEAVMMVPMAISLGFGVLFATFITLVIVPSFYVILEDMHDAIRGLWK